MMLNPNCSEYITRIELTEEDITQLKEYVSELNLEEETFDVERFDQYLKLIVGQSMFIESDSYDKLKKVIRKAIGKCPTCDLSFP